MKNNPALRAAICGGIAPKKEWTDMSQIMTICDGKISGHQPAKPLNLEGVASFGEHFIDPVCRKLEWIAAIITGILAIPIFCDVVARLMFDRSIPGIIEVEEYLFVAIVFFSLAFVQVKKGHISVDLLSGKLPVWVAHLLDVFTSTTTLVLFVVVSWQNIIQIGIKMGETSFSLKIPIPILLAITAFGIVLLTLVLLLDTIRAFTIAAKDYSWGWLSFTCVITCLFLASPFIIKASLSGRPNGFVLGLIGFALMLLLILIKMPIGSAMAVTGFWGMVIISNRLSAPLGMLGVTPFTSTASFVLVVVPLFVLMGELAFHSGMSQDLFEAAYKWLGRLPGGLAMAGVAGCAGFAAVCGDSMSTAVTMGAVSLPEMKKKKYQITLATGSLAAGGTLGILIPPSVGFIFYAIITEESIGKLFIAGVLPGLLLAALFMACIFIMALIKPELAPPGEKTSFKEKMISLKGVVPMLVLFIIILGGIVGGVFSPTEGGGIGVVCAFIISLMRRKVSKEILMKSMHESTQLTAKLMLILIGVGILGYFLAATRLPFMLSDFVTQLPFGRYMIFFSILLLFIILGCMMNVIPMILLILPAIYPSVLAMGFDPIWFGVITVIVMEMGQITPPIGVNVFALSSVAEDVPIETIFKGILPFFICMVICVILLVLFPSIATFLPNQFFNI